jgi:hypothetical protein
MEDAASHLSYSSFAFAHTDTCLCLEENVNASGCDAQGKLL